MHISWARFVAGGIWKGDILIADIEERESKNQCKRSIDNLEGRRIQISQSQMIQQKCREETTNSENPLQGGNKLHGVKISVENFKANRKSLNRQN